MKLASAVAAIAVLLCGCAAFAADDKTPFEVPLPPASASADAPILYCSDAILTHIGGLYPDKTADGKALPAKATARLFNHAEKAFIRLKLRFQAATLGVSFSEPDGSFKQEASFRILSDAPGSYLAVHDRSKEDAIVETITVNRVAGMAVLTHLKASDSDFGPSAMQGFFACSTTP